MGTDTVAATVSAPISTTKPVVSKDETSFVNMCLKNANLNGLAPNYEYPKSYLNDVCSKFYSPDGPMFVTETGMIN